MTVERANPFAASQYHFVLRFVEKQVASALKDSAGTILFAYRQAVANMSVHKLRKAIKSCSKLYLDM
ncbi:hypothetical protein NECAME_03007 [Necator americanus]|uniref:Uncharacterized protein n=1 Tax=Necator americanus TaxID=51031 RepID=W2T832_NECAM|nr:hypothetical protein NECAME_03007 [Necator americanus]ETN78048.1 hypothetical protein NECAME_03007 [Necator americanus]